MKIDSNIGDGFRQIFEAAELCASRDLAIPACMLLYSAIDIAAGLASADADWDHRKRFVEWVNRYVAAKETFGCTALDLYAARCGSVHGFSPHSRLSATGEAAQILYASGKSDVDTLKKMIATLPEGQDHYAAIHVADLLGTVRGAIDTFLRDAERDPAVAQLVNRRAAFIFRHSPDADIDRPLGPLPSTR